MEKKIEDIRMDDYMDQIHYICIRVANKQPLTPQEQLYYQHWRSTDWCRDHGDFTILDLLHRIYLKSKLPTWEEAKRIMGITVGPPRDI